MIIFSANLSCIPGRGLGLFSLVWVCVYEGDLAHGVVLFKFSDLPRGRERERETYG